MKVVKWVLLWLLLVVGAGTIIGGRCLEYYRLGKNGVSVQGIVRERRPHMQISYSFVVSDRTYWGIERAGVDSPPFYEIAIGNLVPVYYIPGDPKVNCVGDPWRFYSNDLPPVLLASFLIPTLIVSALAFRSGRAKLEKGATLGPS
jgi:hypothetical protein